MQRFTSFAAELKQHYSWQFACSGGCKASAGQTGQEQVVNVDSGAVGFLQSG